MNKKQLCWSILLAVCLVPSVNAAPSETVAIVSAERLPASELASYLGRIYPETRFVTARELPVAGKAILVGSDTSVRSTLPAADLSLPESYAVRSQSRCDLQLGVIAGADPRGTMYGVYALLEKLGCGFYLSYDALPPARKGPFSFEGWSLASAPLVRDRFVFDWHNFLSGCSTWNLEDWNRWTDQSQKQGYNGIMVHAYGNNPMVSFTFNGKAKPVGYLSTTVAGRDWSTMHVNDVRRLFGGEVFDSAVFGAAVAQTPDNQRAAAARALMHGVFAHSQQRGMEVFFANDVDTGSANPQELILTLPESARFATHAKAGGMTGVKGELDTQFWLANPETAEGYRYYKAQVAALLEAYPQISCLVVWFRNGGTPWMDFKLAELPPGWQAEYRAAIAKNPEAEKFWHSHHIFAIGKIARAYARALKELGHQRVRLAAGTWNFAFLPAADLFLPPNVPLIGLDYGVLHDDSKLSTVEHRKQLAAVGTHRPVVPVIWAHHDDGNYLGRSYTPFAEFHTKLTEARASGFGIIHWTTRPLDLYFSNHIRQVWQHTRNEPLRATCAQMAAKSFGPAGRTMGNYLERWISEAPKFSRETSDHFIDRPLANIPEVVAGCRERLELMKGVDAAQLAPEQRDRLRYFQGLEEFIAAFFQSHAQFQNAQAALKEVDLAAARAAMAGCRPVPVIEQFAKFSSLGGITRGEQGTVVSLNTRWLPHIVRLRQQLGVEPVRYNFGPTSHDSLAQSPGRFTFHFDAEHRLWQTLGEQEIGVATFSAPKAADEMYRNGIESDKPLQLVLQPILARAKTKPTPMPAGAYCVRLLMADPMSTAAGQRVFEVRVAANTSAAGVSHYRFEAVRAKYLRLLCRGNSENNWNSIIEVVSPALKAGPGTVNASGVVKGHDAGRAVDGKEDTRWATQAAEAWIQFALKPDAALDSLDVKWFEGQRRQYRVEFLVSDDGHQWRTIAAQPASAADNAARTEQVDIFARSGGANRLVELVYPVKLGSAGVVFVDLTPVKGKLLICGAVLEPSR